MLFWLEPNSVKCTSNERKARVVQSGGFFPQIYCKAVEKVVCGQWQVLLRCPIRTCLNSLHFRRFDTYLEV